MLDTIKLKLPLEAIAELNKSAFNIQVCSSGLSGEVLKQKQVLQKHKIFGVKNLELNNLANYLVLELSAKVLKSHYFYGININTIELVVKNINNSGIIKFHSNKFIESAEVLRCDVANNLKVKNKVNTYIEFLNIYRLNTNYNTSYYRSGIVFKKDVKSYKERLIFYDKQMELLRDKELLKVLSSADVLKFNNILRCESNLVSFKAIRSNFNITNNKLLSVLSSKEKVNYKIFNNIVADTEPANINFLNHWKNYKKINKIEKIFGMEHICEFYNYNYGKIKAFIRQSSKGKTSYQYRRYKNFLKKLAIQKEDYNKELEVITELKKLLLVA